MRRRLARVAAVAALALVGAAGACSSFSTDPASGAGDGGDTADASNDGAATGSDGGLPTSGEDGGCAVLATPTAFLPPNGGAKFSNTTSIVDGSVTLTDGTEGSAGLLWYPVPSTSPPPTSFELSFELGLPGSHGDGVAVVWSSNEADSPPPAGSAGENLAFCPGGGSPAPVGAAVGLAFLNHYLLGEISDGGVCTTLGTPLTNVTYGTTQHVAVQVTGGRNVTAAVARDGGSTDTLSVTLTEAVPIHWIGIAGSNGSQAGVDVIDQVSLRVCP